MGETHITRPFGLRAALYGLALIAIITATVVLSDKYAERRAIETERVRLSSVAKLTASSYQRQVDKFRLVATTLSADPDVGMLIDTGTPKAAKRLNERLADLTTALDASVIYVLSADGTTIASSNYRQADSFLGENYRFRAYFRQAMTVGEWEQYALGTRSLIPGLFVARRIITGTRNTGVIVVKIRFDRLEREWASAAGSTFVTSKQGVILVSSIPAWRFQTVRKLGEAEQQKLREQVEFGKAPLRQNALFARNSVISSAEDYTKDTQFIAVQEALPNGLSVYTVSPLKPVIGPARNFARLLSALILGVIAALAVFYVVRRRTIIAAEQRENASRITDLKDRLVQSNKLSSLGQMAAGIGHEINQPLTAIGIRAQNAHKLISAGRAPEAAIVLEEISALTGRMGAITNELRRFARRGDGKMGKVSLQSVFDGTQLLLGDRIRATNTVLLISQTDMPTSIMVLGDQGRLEQVFVNLIQNALDAMGDGGSINITIQVRHPVVEILVRDSGPGIGKDLRQRLFQPFTTSKDTGLGLGLVICRDIITDFGGELSLTDTQPGAEFAITLKVAT